VPSHSCACRSVSLVLTPGLRSNAIRAAGNGEKLRIFSGWLGDHQQSEPNLTANGRNGI
jgi:hypothetical protein